MFVALQCVVLAPVLLSHVSRERSGGYLSAIVDKHARLEEIAPPRLIVVGGSGAAFGVRSDVLEECLGLPVANMALHASLGLPFTLRDVAGEIRTDDLVLLVVEYEQLSRPSGRGRELIGAALARPQSLANFSILDWKAMADGLHGYVGWALRAPLHRRFLWMDSKSARRPYTRDSFAKAGNVVGHHGLRRRNPERQATHIIDLNPAVLRRNLQTLRDFVSMATVARSEVVFSFPPMPQVLYRKNRRVVEEIHRRLRDVSGLLIVGSPASVIYSWDDFFDTKYHMTEEGSAKYTREVARRMVGKLGTRVLRGAVHE